MKKFFAMVAIALFTMASCSDDDSGTTDNGNGSAGGVILPKKEIYTYGTEVSTSIYSYNGTKIDKVDYGDGFYDKVIYTGDLITEWREYDGNTLDAKEVYTYNNQNQLIKEEETRYNGSTVIFSSTYDYTYNNDGSVSYTYSNDGVVGHTGVLTDNTIVGGFRNATATFDNKNNPFKNVTGMDKIAVAYYDHSYLRAANNCVKITGNTNGATIYSFDHTYNNDGYPTKSVQTAGPVSQQWTSEFVY